MTKAADNPGGGGGIGAGLGAGMGMAMAERMARAAARGARARRRRPARHRPRRPRRRRPGRRSAGTSPSDGQATGPYTRDELGRMASDGTITPRQLALDAGRAGLAARPRRERARRSLQRAAAAPAAG